MRIDKSYPDPRAIVSPNAIDLKALNGKTHILCIPITTSRILLHPILLNLLTLSILSRRAPFVINWNALFDVMLGADAKNGIQHLKKKTNTSTERVPRPYTIYIVPWRLINLSHWIMETNLFSIKSTWRKTGEEMDFYYLSDFCEKKCDQSYCGKVINKRFWL